MRLALIGCSIFSREIGYAISQSENTIHAFWLEQGLHNTPQKLNETIQETINKIEEMNEKNNNSDSFRKFDAIVLAYGLCANGVIGLTTNKLRLIIPRCDDCMALFIGSQKKYLELFNNYPGIYWYSKTWMEGDHMPSKEHYEKLYNIYLEEYEDEETAQYLIEQQTGFIKQYGHLYFIKSNIYNDEPEMERAKEIAQDFEWQFHTTDSSLTFINDLLNANWDERFLICNPKQKVIADYTGLKITVE
ncbi:MAG: hypothetical protein ATN31_08315 [Candidatus Epulonipiscioides saccharophilum]|nr:MAG: hypothetical protein ATN31_08315 [Epulopiscium sp. AS2M-Bin001]